MQIAAQIVPAQGAAADTEEVAGPLSRLQVIADVMGASVAQSILRAINSVKLLGMAFSGLKGVMGTLVVALGLAIVIIAAAVKLFQLWAGAVRALAKLLQEIWGWIRWVAEAVWQLNVRIFNWLKAPVVAVVRGTIAVIRRMGEAAVEAAQRIYEMAAAAVTSGVESFGEFDQSVTNVVTVLGKLGPEAVVARTALGANLRGMAFESRSTAAQISDAAYEIASAGWDTVPSVSEMTRASVVLSEATLSDLHNSAATLSSVLNSYEMDSTQAMRAVNVMTAAIAKSPLDMAKMTTALRYAGASAHLFGMTIEQTIAALAVMSKMGLTGSQAGTGLRQVFSGLSRLGPKGQSLLKELGITKDQIDPAKRSMVEVVKVFEQLTQKIGRPKTASLLYQLLGARAGMALAGLVVGGSKAMLEMERAITGTNSAVQMQQDQLNTLQGAWALLKNRWTDAKMMIAEALVPAMRSASGFLLEMAEMARSSGLMTFFGQVLGQGLQQVTALAKQLAPSVFKALGEALSLLPEVFVAIADGAAKAVPYLVQFLAGLPGIIAIFVRDTLPALINFGLTALPVLLQLASIVLPFLAKAIQGIAGALTTFLSDNSANIVQWFTDFTNFVLYLIGQLPTLLPYILQMVQFFMAWVPYLMQVAKDLLPQFVGLLQTLLPIMASLAGNWLTLFVDALQKLGPLLTDLINGPLTAFKDFINTNLPAIRDILSEIVGLIKEFGRVMGEALQVLTAGEGLQPLVDMLKNLREHLAEVVVGILKMAGAMILIKELEMRWKLFQIRIAVEWWSDQGMMIGQVTEQVKAGSAAAQKAVVDMAQAIELGTPGFGVPGRAAGGPVRAGHAYTVGENGPETFVPASDGQIVPHTSAGGFDVYGMGGGGGRRSTEGYSGWRSILQLWDRRFGFWSDVLRGIREWSSAWAPWLKDQTVVAPDLMRIIKEVAPSMQQLGNFATVINREFKLALPQIVNLRGTQTGVNRGPAMPYRGRNVTEADMAATLSPADQRMRSRGVGSGLQLAQNQDPAAYAAAMNRANSSLIRERKTSYPHTMVLQFSNLDDMNGVATGAIDRWKGTQEKMQRLRGPGHGPIREDRGPGGRWDY